MQSHERSSEPRDEEPNSAFQIKVRIPKRMAEPVSEQVKRVEGGRNQAVEITSREWILAALAKLYLSILKTIIPTVTRIREEVERCATSENSTNLDEFIDELNSMTIEKLLLEREPSRASVRIFHQDSALGNEMCTIFNRLEESAVFEEPTHCRKMPLGEFCEGIEPILFHEIGDPTQIEKCADELSWDIA